MQIPDRGVYTRHAEVPDRSGVYALRAEGSKDVYIGSTGSLSGRFADWRAESAAFTTCDKIIAALEEHGALEFIILEFAPLDIARQIEAALINKCHPSLNTIAPSIGRVAEGLDGSGGTETGSSEVQLPNIGFRHASSLSRGRRRARRRD